MNGEEKKIEEVAMDGWELTSVPLLSAYFCEQAKHSSQYCAISTKPTGDKEKECTMQQIENAKVLANVISAALCWLSFAKDHLDEPDDVCPLAIKNAIACLQEGIDTCASQAQESSSPSGDVMSNVVIPHEEWSQICRWLHHYNSTNFPRDMYADDGKKLNEWCRKNGMSGERKRSSLNAKVNMTKEEKWDAAEMLLETVVKDPNSFTKQAMMNMICLVLGMPDVIVKYTQDDIIALNRQKRYDSRSV